MHSVLNLLLEFPFPSFIRVTAVAIRIANGGIRRGRSRSPYRYRIAAESKRGGRNGKEAVLNGFEGAVDDGVDRVDDFVNEGLKFARGGLAGGAGVSKV